jgi:hypothetical protein
MRYQTSRHNTLWKFWRRNFGMKRETELGERLKQGVIEVQTGSSNGKLKREAQTGRNCEAVCR